MEFHRRNLLLAMIAATICSPLRSQRSSSAAPWVELFKVLGDIGESLHTFSDAVGKITVQTVGGYVWLKDRNARAGLVALTGKLTALVADQDEVRIALDRFGNRWRQTHHDGHRPTTEQLQQLRVLWTGAIMTVRRITLRTKEMLGDVRSQQNDIDLEDAYADLQNALVAKGGVLGSIAMLPQPNSGDDIKDLVSFEETFLGLRAATRTAQKALNDAIRRMPR